MAFKRMKPARPAASAPIGSQLAAAMRHIAALKEENAWNEAQEYAEKLVQRYPGRKEPLELALDVALESEDMFYAEPVLNKLLKITPNNPDYAVALAGAALSNGFMALARERFHNFLERWPEHTEAEEARKTLAALEEALAKAMDEAGLFQPNRLELAARNDEIQTYIAHREFREARRVAQKLLDQDAVYVPALNNLALSHLLEGNLIEAASGAQRVLEIMPDNIHALSNLAHALLLLGRADEAARYAEQLKASKAYATDKTVKIMETLSFLGDDEGILAIYETAQRDKNDASHRVPLPHHLAGAAALRLGREKEARRYWAKALKLDRKFVLAEENVADLELPVGQRHAPWAYSIGYWIPREALSDLLALTQASIKSGPEKLPEKAKYAALQSLSFLEVLVPILLERGDPAGRQVAILAAKNSRTPEMLAALRDFALSRNGPDAMRMDAAAIVKDAGMLEPGAVRMWIRGEWREVMLMDWELYEEPGGSHTPRVEKLETDAIEALYNGDGKRGEKLLKQALEIEPDAPDLLNNLANAYKLQKRGAEAKDLMSQIHNRFPDYFFGIVNMAHVRREEGRLEDAETLLAPLLSQKRLHITEFVALAQAQIELLLAKGDEEAARQWFDMWKQALPDHQALLHYRIRFDGPNLLKPGVIEKLFKKR